MIPNGLPVVTGAGMVLTFLYIWFHLFYVCWNDVRNKCFAQIYHLSFAETVPTSHGILIFSYIPEGVSDLCQKIPTKALCLWNLATSQVCASSASIVQLLLSLEVLQKLLCLTALVGQVIECLRPREHQTFEIILQRKLAGSVEGSVWREGGALDPQSFFSLMCQFKVYSDHFILGIQFKWIREESGLAVVSGKKDALPECHLRVHKF